MDKMYYMFNKPKGCITARTDEKHKTVMDYFPEDMRNILHPVGRLDKDTEGFLIITNDGVFNQKLMHPEFHVPKIYYFQALGNLDDEKIRKLQSGVELIGEKDLFKAESIEVDGTGNIKEIANLIAGTKFEKAARNPRNGQTVAGKITITEGKKHQVKRMLKAVGCYVVYLKRTQIGEVELDDNLKSGEYRELTEEEISILNK
ncbi:MAG: pseudouridine synthase [Clostridiales bacterium]|nr:pseudouridine synthase [Clostridiales bacterium]MDD6292853.1 16S rRNA pseudouridine(516) synthase [Eubacteriales bacterium]